MDISLTEELERFISQKVESGLYPSASDVVRDGLRLLQEKDEAYQAKLADLRREIDIGLEQANRGLVTPFDEELLERIKARGRERLKARLEGEPA